MDIAVAARRAGGDGLVWLGHCDGKRAWVTSLMPGERRTRIRELRRSRTLVGEYASSDAAFRAAWDKLMRIDPGTAAGKRSTALDEPLTQSRLCSRAAGKPRGRRY